MSPKAIILTGFGINCDYETQWAFQRAGASAERVHINDLIAAPCKLDECHILAVPGGFSFGDDIASGRILANRLRHKLGSQLEAFVDAGKLVIGICNGFQVLVKMGLLPRIDDDNRQTVTVTHNDSHRFEDRWVYLEPNPDTPCVWLRGMEAQVMEPLMLPVRHGEGKVIAAPDTCARLQKDGLDALWYVLPSGAPARGAYPANPNGSLHDIAGICDPTGRVFGLMPHPEAFIRRTQHPRWTREALPEEGAGLRIFRNAVGVVQRTLLRTPAAS